MKNWNGAELAEVAFSHPWELYLSSYHIDAKPDNWFSKTVAQAFDALPEAETSALINYLIYPLQDGLQQKKEYIPKGFMLLYDELLEPYFQRKFSIVIIIGHL